MLINDNFVCIVDISSTIDYRQTVVTAEHILLIIDDIAQNWRDLCVRLKLPTSVIGIIDADGKNVRNKGWEECLKWTYRQASGATLGVLTDALENVGKRSCARTLLGTVEPRMTATSVIRSPRYYGRYILALQNGHTFPGHLLIRPTATF